MKEFIVLSENIEKISRLENPDPDEKSKPQKLTPGCLDAKPGYDINSPEGRAIIDEINRKAKEKKDKNKGK